MVDTPIFNFGLGVSLLYDTRDYINYPTSGLYLNVVAKVFFADFHYQKYSLDLRKYISFDHEKNHILATWLNIQFTPGETPYYFDNYIGSDLTGKTGRGYILGSVASSNTYLYLETEYRDKLLNSFICSIFLNIHSFNEDERFNSYRSSQFNNNSFQYVNGAFGYEFGIILNGETRNTLNLGLTSNNLGDNFIYI